jgi:hypothetical protein
MTTKLDKALKREIEVNGVAYRVTITPEGLSIVGKGKRKGKFVTWEFLLSGEAELAADLRASVEALREEE